MAHWANVTCRQVPKGLARNTGVSGQNVPNTPLRKLSEGSRLQFASDFLSNNSTDFLGQFGAIGSALIAWLSRAAIPGVHPMIYIGDDVFPEERSESVTHYVQVTVSFRIIGNDWAKKC